MVLEVLVVAFSLVVAVVALPLLLLPTGKPPKPPPGPPKAAKTQRKTQFSFTPELNWVNRPAGPPGTDGRADRKSFEKQYFMFTPP